MSVGAGASRPDTAAGAIAAAARELRPSEIVGVYETKREAAEVRLGSSALESVQEWCVLQACCCCSAHLNVYKNLLLIVSQERTFWYQAVYEPQPSTQSHGEALMHTL